MRALPALPAVIAGAGVLLSVPPAGASEAVSPGRTDATTQISTACPTFSWTTSAVAREVELAVQDLSANSQDQAGALALHAMLPAGASSWTPDDSRCLERGGRYAWTIRARGPEGDGPWSEPRFFSVAATSNVSEVSQALEVLERFLRQNEVSAPAAESSIERPRQGDSLTGRQSDLEPFDFDSARAALRGQLPETTGETLGVAGLSNSPDGAGVAAANTDPGGGADLLLDGSNQGLADTILTESGIDRPSASDQTFTVANTGTGGMTLHVDGMATIAATGATALNVSGGIQAGTGNVGIVGTDGRIPDISDTFFADLDGSNLTGVIASEADTLDDLDSNQFLRSDVSDTFAGAHLMVEGSASFATGAGGQAITFGASSADTSTFNGTVTFSDPVVTAWGAASENMTLANATTAAGTHLLRVESTGAGSSFNDGIQVRSTGTGTITDGIDVSDAEITNAINIGANDISGTNFSVAGSTGAVSATSATLVSSIQLTPVSDASGSSPGACGGATTGTVYYDVEENLPCFCDGTNYMYITDAATTCNP